MSVGRLILRSSIVGREPNLPGAYSTCSTSVMPRYRACIATKFSYDKLGYQHSLSVVKLVEERRTVANGQEARSLSRDCADGARTVARRGSVGPPLPATQSHRSANRREGHSHTSQGQMAQMVDRNSIIRKSFRSLQASWPRLVRFAPNSRHRRPDQACPKSARRRHQRPTRSPRRRGPVR